MGGRCDKRYLDSRQGVTSDKRKRREKRKSIQVSDQDETCLVLRPRLVSGAHGRVPLLHGGPAVRACEGVSFCTNPQGDTDKHLARKF